jgi:hypothetical protein
LALFQIIGGSMKTTNPHPRPTPDQIRSRRTSLGLTQTQSAELIRGTLRGWQEYEYGHRNMHPGLWCLYQLRTPQFEPDELD